VSLFGRRDDRYSEPVRGYTLEEVQQKADLLDTEITPVEGGYHLEVSFPGGRSYTNTAGLGSVMFDLNASIAWFERNGIALPLDYGDD
jgi:hypothetical protein